MWQVLALGGRGALRLTEEQVCEGGEWLEDPKSFLKLAFLQKNPVVNVSEIMFAVGRPFSGTIEMGRGVAVF